MIFHGPGKATKLKKIVYLFSFIILGLLLSFNLHTLLEITYLNWISSQGQVAQFYGGCALHPLIQGFIWLLGIVSGYFSGSFFWQKLYVERRWGKYKFDQK